MISDPSLPPQNIEAEESILGGILLDPKAMGKIIDFLVADAFYVRSHQEIYRAAIDLQNKGKPTDLMTVSSWLQDHHALDEVGGIPRLLQLVDRTVSAANIDRYAELVMDKYVRRQLITTGGEIIELARDTTLELENVFDESEQKIFRLTQKRPQDGLIFLGDTLVDTFNEIEKLQEQTTLPGIATNFYDLDAITSGFQPSDLIIIAGRPSMGKCLEAGSEIVLADGSVASIEKIYNCHQARLLTLADNWRFTLTEPSDFIDNGIKPVFRVITKLGRSIETTLTHPFLTIQGWRSLSELPEGAKIAVPRRINIFGTETLPDYQIKLLAYLIGDGCLTHTSPQFTNSNPQIQQDFIEAAQNFPYVKIRMETSGGKRTPSFIVTKDFTALEQHRTACGQAIDRILTDSPIPARQIAARIGVSPALLTLWKQGKCFPRQEQFSGFCQGVTGATDHFTSEVLQVIGENGQNPLTAWLRELGLWGKNAQDKTIPSLIFQLKKSCLSLFLNRLFSTDGWACVLRSGQVQIGFASVSEKLARQVQHLLLRFGIIATLKKRQVKYKENRNLAWQIDITDAKSIQLFIDEINIFGKERAIESAKEALQGKRYQTNRDLIPLEIWTRLTELKGSSSWKEIAQKAGISECSNLHVVKRSPSRERLLKLAIALENEDLQNLSTSDIYWDEIVSITYSGNKQVYDLTIPETHNFVANDVCVHNTSFAINIAHNIARQHLPVAIFSLEMSKEQLAQRLLSSESNIPSNLIRSGRIPQNDMEKLLTGLDKLSALPIYIDDSANSSVIQMRSQVRRLQAEKKGQIGLVLIDYLQLMEGGGDNRVQELSKITRSLKALAREIHAPVIALSQLSRTVESRNNKRPMMSDLRESGSIEQDADLIIMLYRDEYYNQDSPDRGVAEAIITKHRNGPTGTIKLLFQPEFTKFLNMKQSRSNY